MTDAGLPRRISVYAVQIRQKGHIMRKHVLLKHGKSLLALAAAASLAWLNPMTAEAAGKSYWKGAKDLSISLFTIEDDTCFELGDIIYRSDDSHADGCTITIITNGTLETFPLTYDSNLKGYEIANITDLYHLGYRTMSYDTNANGEIIALQLAHIISIGPVINQDPTPSDPATEPAEEQSKPSTSSSKHKHEPSEEEQEAIEAAKREAAKAAEPQHEHSFSWVTTASPTETSDGREEYRCGCGVVADSRPISVLVGVVDNVMDEITNAPENGTLVIDSDYLRCLSSKMIDQLKERPDLDVTVIFTDNGVTRQFTIPAGQAPTDGAEYYGYYYLGTIYGWQ